VVDQGNLLFPVREEEVGRISPRDWHRRLIFRVFGVVQCTAHAEQEKMADALAKMKEEMDRKRKLREESSAANSEGGGPKKKVYLTKGQLKQLDEKKASGVGAADAVNGADDEALSDSPKKNGSGDAGGGLAKKYIPAHEVVRRLRCAPAPPFPSQPPPPPPCCAQPPRASLLFLP
jgi:hypothetical protein